MKLAVDYALRANQPLGNAVRESAARAPGPSISGESFLGSIVGPHIASLLPGTYSHDQGIKRTGAGGVALDTAFMLPLLRGPRALFEGARAAFAAESGSRVAEGASAAKSSYRAGKGIIRPTVKAAASKVPTRTFRAGGLEVKIPAARSRTGQLLEKVADTVRPAVSKTGLVKTETERAGSEQGRSVWYQQQVQRSTADALSKVGKKLSDSQEYALRILAEGASPAERVTHHIDLATADTRPANVMYHGIHADLNQKASQYIEMHTLSPAERTAFEATNPGATAPDAIPLLAHSAPQQLKQAWELFQKSGDLREGLLKNLSRISDEQIAARVHGPGRIIKGARYRSFEGQINDALAQSPVRNELHAAIDQQIPDTTAANAEKQLFDAMIRSHAQRIAGDPQAVNELLSHLSGIQHTGSEVPTGDVLHQTELYYRDQIKGNQTARGAFEQARQASPGDLEPAISAAIRGAIESRDVPLAKSLMKDLEARAPRVAQQLSQARVEHYVLQHAPEEPVLAQRSDLVQGAFPSSDQRGPFFSKLGETVLKMPDKFGVQEFLGRLKSAGVKDEEVRWSELPTFLRTAEARGEKSITKEEVLAWLDEHYLVLEENLRSQQPVHTNLPDEQNSDSWKFVGYSLPDARDANYGELTIRLPEDQYGSLFSYESHFPDQNILLHVRFSDRTVDGKKTLFLEELQSDWHQQAQKKGYRVGASPEIEKAYTDAQAEVERLYSTEAEIQSPEFQDALTRRNDAYQAYSAANRGVADAPFKKTWHELGVKRMLAWAAEHGYERLAWTTGRQQAERYGLANFFDRIEVTPFYEVGGDYYNERFDSAWNHYTEYSEDLPAYPHEEDFTDASGHFDEKAYAAAEKTYVEEYEAAEKHFSENFATDWENEHYSEDTYTIKAWNKDSDSSASPDHTQSAEDHELEDYVGPDLAEKIRAGQTTFEGKDFAVGENAKSAIGASKFYDDKLVSFANKYLKPLKVGVETRKLETPGETSFDVINEDGTVVGTHPTREGADLSVRSHANLFANDPERHQLRVQENLLGNHPAPHGEPVHSIDVTPDVVHFVKSGQTLFQRGGALDSASTYGIKGAIEFTDAHQAVIHLTQAADATTFVHEMAHLVRRFGLAPNEEKRVARWAGAEITNRAERSTARKAGQPIPEPVYVWNTAAEEKFARGIEQYVRTGSGPTGVKQAFTSLSPVFRDVYEHAELPDVPAHVAKTFEKLFGFSKQRGGRIMGAEDVRIGVAYAPTWRGMPIRRLSEPHKAMAAYFRRGQALFSGGERHAIGAGPDDAALRHEYTGSLSLSGYFTKDVVGPKVEKAILANKLSAAHIARKAFVQAGEELPKDFTDIAVVVDPTKDSNAQARATLWEKMKSVDESGRKLTAKDLDGINFDLVEKARQDVFPAATRRQRRTRGGSRTTRHREPIDNVVWVRVSSSTSPACSTCRRQRPRSAPVMSKQVVKAMHLTGLLGRPQRHPEGDDPLLQPGLHSGQPDRQPRHELHAAGRLHAGEPLALGDDAPRRSTSIDRVTIDNVMGTV
jgi:hypothetical protein